MVDHFKVGLTCLVVLFALLICACDGHETTTDKNKTVNFLPNTYIDSLYIKYIDSEGLKKISNANNLLTAIYEEETADTLMQFTTTENPEVIDAFVNYWMGEYFCYSCRFNEAENVSLVALEKAPKVKSETFELEVNSLLGLICQRMGKNEDALKYMQKCYESSSQTGNLEDQSSDLSNLAAISLSLRDIDLAKSYIDKAIEIEEQLNRDNLLAIRYGIASEVYQTLGELEKAEKFARDAYALDKKGGREGKAAIRLSQLAAVLIAKGEKDEAIEKLLEALPPLKANGNSYSLAVVENQLGSLYLERNQNALAAEHFKIAYDITKDGGNLYFLQRALSGLANSLKSTDINEAYNYLEQSATIADSIYQLNNKKELAEIEQKYKESEALRESEHQVYEHKIQNYAMMIVLVISILVISLLFFILHNKNKNQQLMKRLEKMRSNFFTNITHEFRTPITVIMGMSSNIMQDPKASKEIKISADTISSQSRGLLNLVNQLLDISKVQSEIGTPDWRHGNVISYMHMVAERYMQTASHRGINLVFSPSENVIIMDFVPQYILRILHNLISNSLKFTSKGGYIYISTSVKNDRLILRVADNGVGIDRGDLEQIFKPYYQGKNSTVEMGTGIGLSLVYQMVKAMEGTIDVKSVKDKGSIFTLSIPLTHEGNVKEIKEGEIKGKELVDNLIIEKSEEAISPEANCENNEDKPILLIVEDHSEVATYIGSHLSQYNVVYARNGLEGLTKAKELIPDVIVTDVMMPEMDGLEMTQEIRSDAALSHIPVIVITAKAEEQEKIRALEMGVDAYLIKPFNHDELEVRVKQLIMQRRMLCEKYQRALATGNIENEEMPISDRQFISNLVSLVYDMTSKGESIDLEILASRLNMTSRTLSRKLQVLTGDTPLLYINKIKVSKAKSIIDKDPRTALSDVAFQCGFEDPSYFSRIFKQLEGISPTAYRRRIKF